MHRATKLILLFALVSGCSDKTTPSTESISSSTTEVKTSAALPPEAERGFETPEAAFVALAKAEGDKDWAAVMGTLTSDSGKIAASRMLIGLGFVAAFDESKADQVKAIYAKYGMGDEQKMRTPPPGITRDSTQNERAIALGNMISDPVAFSIEVYEWLDKQPESKTHNYVLGKTLGEVSVLEDTATGPLSTRKGPAKIGFTKSAAGWLVDLTTSDTSPPSGRTISGSGKVDGFGFQKPEPDNVPVAGDVTLEEINTSWKTTIDVSDRPAIDVLKELSEKWGLSIFDQPKLADALMQPVSVTLTDVSPLQIVEEVCAQVNVHPRYRVAAMTFNEGPRTLPIAFAGPFLIEVTELQEYVPNAYAKLKLQAFAAGLPTAAVAQFRDRQVRNTEDPDQVGFLTSAFKGSDGSDIAPEFLSYFRPKLSETTVLLTGEVEVRNLLQAVESIAAFDGEITWSWPGETVTSRTEKITDGEFVEIGDAKIEFTNVSLGKFSSIRLKLEGTTAEDLSVVAHDADGKPLSKARVSSMTINGEKNSFVNVNGEPAGLEFHMIASRNRVSFPFQFPAIPLNYHRYMPESLAEPAFEGESPLSIEFVRLNEKNGRKTAIFHWTNLSNKDIFEIETVIEYLDADGEVLKKRDKTIGMNRVMLDYGESEDTTLLGDFPPDGAAAANVQVKSVEFSDTTTWSAAE